MRGARSILSWLENNNSVRPKRERDSERNPRPLGNHTDLGFSGRRNDLNNQMDNETRESTVGQLPGGYTTSVTREHDINAQTPTVQSRSVQSNDNGEVDSDRDDSGTIITEQPLGLPSTMNYMNFIPSETTFPFNRGPNLSKLTKGGDQ